MDHKSNSSANELDLKLSRIQVYLEEQGLDGLLLQRTDNFAWATCGGNSYINRANSLGAASLLITRSDQFVITNNIEAKRLAQEEGLEEQGWEFKVSPWYDAGDLLSNLIKGMKLGADHPFPRAVDVASDIVSIRSQLTPQEGERFRELGRLCAEGMGAAVSAVEPGQTEYEIAAELSRSVERKGVQVVVNLVAVDERIFTYRHPLPTTKKLHRYAMLILCGRKGGLVCSITRLIHFGPLPEEIQHKSQAVAEIDAVMIDATRPGRTIGEVFQLAQEAYAASGYPEEWKLHHQGGSAGYAPREVLATPASTIKILEGQAFAWNPSIAGAKSEDTILVGETGCEIITKVEGWPTKEIHLDGRVIKRPAIMVKT